MKNIFGLLTNPGDKFEALISQTGRQIIKITKGGTKFSAVRYPNGRIVETRSYMEGAKTITHLLEKVHK